MNLATRLLLAIVSCLIIAVSPSLLGADADPARIPFTLPGGTGAAITLEAAIYRPGTGTRFPLAVVSHGDPRNASARRTMYPDYAVLTAWLVDHGYAVIVPMRRGFGSSDGDFVEGPVGPCNNRNHIPAGLTGADDIGAAIEYMRAQPFVDSSRIVLVGHSGGGLASLAEASRNPQGLVAVVNFAGGLGSTGPDVVCSPDRLVDGMASFGKTTRVPTLWIYSENDHFFGPALARKMFAAFAASSPQAEFFAAPPYDGDGHELVLHAGTGWESPIDDFLKKVVPGP